MATMPYRQIDCCRVCGNTELTLVLDLGAQALTGIFPKRRDQHVTSGPLQLVKCSETNPADHCGLLQLRHSYNPVEMYGSNYGYRSGLNEAMTRHLQSIVARIRDRFPLETGDIVLDIGSNDGTLLSGYPAGLRRIGIDPTAEKFREFYPAEVELAVDFFSTRAYRSVAGPRKAKVVTSIAMFYDLESPLDFMRDIKEVLADNGIWVLEQSYMPTMLEQTAYDTVCHEHLEYYGLRQLQWMAERAGFRILDIELNDINGGSFQVTLAHANSEQPARADAVARLLHHEKMRQLDTPAPFREFETRVRRHREELPARLHAIAERGQLVLGYGASTKGNVVLQYCGIAERDLPAIAERNPDKYGRFTPGTLIPIISEVDAHARKPDYLMPLPWHFRTEFIRREREFLNRGGKFLFPLPHIEEVGA